MLPSQTEFVPAILCGIDGEPPFYVSYVVAPTPADALAYAAQSGEIYGPDEGLDYEVRPVLMRELDPIACKIRGLDEGWWVECTRRAKKHEPFWRIDE